MKTSPLIVLNSSLTAAIARGQVRQKRRADERVLPGHMIILIESLLWKIRFSKTSNTDFKWFSCLCSLTHGTTPASEEVNESDNELFHCVMLNPLTLFGRLSQEDVYVASHLTFVFYLDNPTSPSV